MILKRSIKITFCDKPFGWLWREILWRNVVKLLIIKIPALSLSSWIHDATWIIIGEVHWLIVTRCKFWKDLELFLFWQNKIRKGRVVIIILSLFIIWRHLLVKNLAFIEVDINFVFFLEYMLFLLEFNFNVRSHLFCRLIKVAI